MKIKIDETKIVKGQMKYVIKLMKMTKEQTLKEVLEIHKRLSDEISSWKEYDEKFVEEITKLQERFK